MNNEKGRRSTDLLKSNKECYTVIGGNMVMYEPSYEKT